MIVWSLSFWDAFLNVKEDDIVECFMAIRRPRSNKNKKKVVSYLFFIIKYDYIEPLLLIYNIYKIFY